MMIEDWASSGNGIGDSKVDYLRLYGPSPHISSGCWYRGFSSMLRIRKTYGMGEDHQVAAFCDVVAHDRLCLGTWHRYRKWLNRL